LAGHATIIAVIVDTKKNLYTVLDNGRGIPLENDTPIIISSKLFSGAKFQKTQMKNIGDCRLQLMVNGKQQEL